MSRFQHVEHRRYFDEYYKIRLMVLGLYWSPCWNIEQNSDNRPKHSTETINYITLHRHMVRSFWCLFRYSLAMVFFINILKGNVDSCGLIIWSSQYQWSNIAQYRYAIHIYRQKHSKSMKYFMAILYLNHDDCNTDLDGYSIPLQPSETSQGRKPLKSMVSAIKCHTMLADAIVSINLYKS